MTFLNIFLINLNIVLSDKYLFIIKMQIEKSLCHMRWGYPNISLTRSEIRTCCKTPFQTVNQTEIKEQGIELFLNNPYQIERRYEMFKGIRHHSCNQCWQVEDQGATSLRVDHMGFVNFANKNNLFNEFPEKNLQEIAEAVSIDSKILRSDNPFMLEVSLGNNCDLKCMYCNHVYSSQWATESLKNFNISQEIYDSVSSKPNQEFIDLFWKWVDTKAKFSLERIGIIGGEPLITPECYSFIDRLLDVYKDVEHDSTTIWIVTNLNTPKIYLDRFLNYLPKLNTKFKLEILISMESVENQAEYIRNGLDWKRFESNVYKLFEYTKNNNRVTLGFLPSITALSIPRYKKFLQWVYKVCIDTKKPAMLKQNIVTWPNCHTPFILPNNFSEYLTEAIEWLSTVNNELPAFEDHWGRWDSYVSFLINLRDSIKNNIKDQTELKKQFYDWFNKFDNLRQINFTETFPELKEFYESCKDIK